MSEAMTLEAKIAEEKTSLDTFLESENSDEIVRSFIKQRPIDWLFALLQQENAGLTTALKKIEELDFDLKRHIGMIGALIARIEKLEVKTNH